MSSSSFRVKPEYSKEYEANHIHQLFIYFLLNVIPIFFKRLNMISSVNVNNIFGPYICGNDSIFSLYLFFSQCSPYIF